MIFLISGTLFKEETCCKFMLKLDIKNYFRQFTKSLSIVSSETHHTETCVCVTIFKLSS